MTDSENPYILISSRTQACIGKSTTILKHGGRFSFHFSTDTGFTLIKLFHSSAAFIQQSYVPQLILFFNNSWLIHSFIHYLCLKSRGNLGSHLIVTTCAPFACAESMTFSMTDKTSTKCYIFLGYRNVIYFLVTEMLPGPCGDEATGGRGESGAVYQV